MDTICPSCDTAVTFSESRDEKCAAYCTKEETEKAGPDKAETDLTGNASGHTGYGLCSAVTDVYTDIAGTGNTKNRDPDLHEGTEIDESTGGCGILD